MTDVQGIIFADDRQAEMGELTEFRSMAALPVAGRYRLVDFILSNMVNSGIYHVGIVTQRHYQSLMDHVGTGKPWDLDRKSNGLFVLPPYSDDSFHGGAAEGEIDLLGNIRWYLLKSSHKYVLLAGSNVVCSIPFESVLRRHMDSGSDITVVGRAPVEDLTGVLTNRRGGLLGMYLLEKSLLLKLISQSLAYNEHDWVSDIVLKNRNRLKISVYPFEGYARKITDKASYFDFNMQMLRPEKRGCLFGGERPIFTKVKDEPPTKYGDEARVTNSLIADGCRIYGRVENSILFRGVYVGRDAVIKDSIVMQGSHAYEGSTLQHVILDKDVTIKCGSALSGHTQFPMVVRKRSVI